MKLRNILILVVAIYGYAVVYCAIYIVVSIITPAHIT